MERLLLDVIMGAAIVGRASVIVAGLAIACATFTVPAARAEDAGAEAPKPVFGTYDTATGVFTPAKPEAMPAILPDAPAAAPIVRKGTLVVQVAADVAAIPAGQPVLAFISAYLFDTSYQNSVGTSVTMKRSGNTAKVSFSMPYVFTVLSASETVTVSVQLATQKLPYPTTVLTKKIPLPADAAKTVVAFPAAM